MPRPSTLNEVMVWPLETADGRQIRPDRAPEAVTCTIQNAIMPSINRVLETCVYARDLAAAEGFYGEVLELERVSREEGRHVFFRCGAQMVLVFNPEATSESGGMLPPHGARGAGHVAFAVAAEAIDDWIARFKAAGVEVEKDVSWGDAGRSIYVRDPAGNSIELATPSIWEGG